MAASYLTSGGGGKAVLSVLPDLLLLLEAFSANEGRRGGVLPDVWRLHEAVMSVSPDLWRLHEAVMSVSPDLWRLHETVFFELPDAWRLHEAVVSVSPDLWRLHEAVFFELSDIWRLHEAVISVLPDLWRLHEVVFFELSDAWRLHEAVFFELPDLWWLPAYLSPCCGCKAAVADFKFSFHEIALSYSFSADFVAGCILSLANHCFIDFALEITLFKKE